MSTVAVKCYEKFEENDFMKSCDVVILAIGSQLNPSDRCDNLLCVIEKKVITAARIFCRESRFMYAMISEVR